jgi:hypothetical protein
LVFSGSCTLIPFSDSPSLSKSPFFVNTANVLGGFSVYC